MESVRTLDERLLKRKEERIEPGPVDQVPAANPMENSQFKRDDETLDELACGGLFVLQKRTGYRYSVDAYLLAAFVDEKPGTAVLDIGSGSGVISLLLAGMKGLHVTGIEIQEEAAEMSRRSVAFAGFEDKVRIVCADVRDYTGPRVEAVVTNPPYRPMQTGRVNPEKGRALARHEILLDLDTLLERSCSLLKPGGRLYLVYPVWRLPDLISAMRCHRIEPKKMTFVHSTCDASPEICLVCGSRDGGKELVVSKPFVVFTRDGVYSPEMESVFQKLMIPKSH